MRQILESGRCWTTRFTWLLIVFAGSAAVCEAATIELLTGAKVEGTVLSKDAKSVTVEITIAGKPIKRVIPLSSVHKVTINDKEYVINAKGSSGSTAAPSAGQRSASAASESLAGDQKDEGPLRTRAEVDALINREGRTPPAWFDDTPLNYPQSLDLDWPEKPPGGWNNQKNVGQYIWDIINPNPNKWREGVKLLHHLLSMHQSDSEKRVRIMNSLGAMYHNLHQDYARAAFWWRQAGSDKPNSRFPHSTVHLAECYYRLGNKQMAVELLRKSPIAYATIKLWADMGETQEAVKLAEEIAKLQGAQADVCYLYAGDAYRTAGRFPQALGQYEKVLKVPAKANPGRVERNQERARASIEAIKLFELLDVSQVGDGSYKSQSIGYEGPIHVEVAVKSGRIESVRITQHKEKQFYSAMTDTPAQIISKQGVKGVDATSGATITSEAIINATAKALASGSK